MNDGLGRELKVGDMVAHAAIMWSSGPMGFNQLRVVSFTPKMVKCAPVGQLDDKARAIKPTAVVILGGL